MGWVIGHNKLLRTSSTWKSPEPSIPPGKGDMARKPSPSKGSCSVCSVSQSFSPLDPNLRMQHFSTTYTTRSKRSGYMYRTDAYKRSGYFMERRRISERGKRQRNKVLILPNFLQTPLSKGKVKSQTGCRDGHAYAF